MHMTMVKLLTGVEVDSASEEWRLECLARHRHVLNMRRISLQSRRDYLANVERREGAESAARLRRSFTEDWEQRKAQGDV